MTLTFVNGGEPDYQGFSFSSGTNLLSKINDTLVLAGATSLSISSNQVRLRLNAIENSDTCFVQFYLTTAGILRVQMAQTSAFTTLSPEFRIAFTEGSPNRLWMACNQDHWAIAIQGFNGSIQSLFGGYLLRLSSSDTFAYVIGIPTTIAYDRNGYNGQTNSDSANLYVGKGFINGTNWLAPVTRFPNAISSSSLDNNKSYINTRAGGISSGFTNRHLVSHTPIRNELNNDNDNAGRFASVGNNNGLNGKTVISEYYYIEGRASETDYDIRNQQLAPLLFFRGVIQNVVVGFSHLLGGTQIETEDEKRYISGGDIYYQGIRIK